jgi:hypothetical protein
MRLTIEGVEGLRKVISGIGISVLIGAGLGGFVLL